MDALLTCLAIVAVFTVAAYFSDRRERKESRAYVAELNHEWRLVHFDHPVTGERVCKPVKNCSPEGLTKIMAQLNGSFEK